MELMPQAAPFVVLAFLGTVFLGGLCVLGLVVAAWKESMTLAKVIAGVALAVGAGYGGVLLTASVFSSEKVLTAGQKKYFCEIDCHLAYSVSEVTSAKIIGTPVNQAKAAGDFYVVTLQTFFDPKTISAKRGNGLLYPNDRIAFVEDESGNRFGPSLEGQRALQLPAAKMVPLTQPLRPGETYETTLVFDLPAGVQKPKLLLTDPIPVNWVLIGHENSFFHKKIYFGLQPTGAVSRLQ